MHATDIVAYIYRADIYCPQCIGHLFSDERSATRGGYLGMPGGGAEAVLDQVADDMDIDRHDERTYDSSQFPKVVWADQINDCPHGVESCHECGTPERCRHCGTEL